MAIQNFLRAALAAALLGGATSAVAATMPNGKGIYDASCAACHSTGVAGAPKLSDAAAWGPRIKTGATALYASATKGKGAMPARGGNPALSDAEVNAAVNYMIGQADNRSKAAPTPAPAPAPKPAPTVAQVKPPVAAPASQVKAAPVSVAPVPAVAAAVAPAATALAVAGPGAGGVNTFNRLMRPPAQRNLPPAEDGIHDPANDGTHALQPPLTAFAPMSKSGDGNRVDWVKALNDKLITPRTDRNDPAVQPMVMDLNIVREVKGSMPDVVYPHKQHTQWLDCSNCHPAIFIPQKGANQISMASILLGQKCGVCHGKVAFPVSDCRRCHSKSKLAPAPEAAKP